MKKKILMLAVAACLIVLSIASSSLAYFTDIDSKTNTFTAGNVAITLDYTPNPEEARNLYPGMTYADKALITNTGSEKAYIGAIITFENTEVTADTLRGLFGLNATNTEITVSGYKIFVVFKGIIDTGSDNAVTVFNGMTIPATWNNAEMAKISNLKVTVKAYATQTVFSTESGIDTAAEALATAFPADWGN